jgi:outer membrane lipase/esterase
MNRRQALCATASLPGMLVGTPSMAETFTALVAFGDSLSDNGNAGRFSNGPVWVEYMAQALGLELHPSRLGGSNHAVGGALAAGAANAVTAQVRGHLAGRDAADPRALYTIWAGGNDLLAAGLASEPDAAAVEAASAVGSAVDTLVTAGARAVLVPNLPDIAMTPAVRLAGARAAAMARRISAAYDQTLTAALDRLEADHVVPILRLDVRALAERVLADPAAAGFRNVSEPCQGRPSCDGYVFWDMIHPTAQAHARLAAAALEVVAAARRG